MKYDDASWHSGGDFPTASPKEYGGTHIALFIKWCFIKGWAGQLHLDEWPEDVAQVIIGGMPATEFLFKNLDGKFTDEDLTEEGNHFANAYYGEKGDYLSDYAATFGSFLYLAPESDHDFARVSQMIEKRWISLNAPEQIQEKPWWKIW
jgi:hypothetical protein